MAKTSSRKKTKVSPRKKATRRVTKKATPRRTTKKRAVRRVPKPLKTRRKVATKKTAAKKLAIKRNPVPQRFWLQIGSRYFDGAGMTANARNAASFQTRQAAVRVANRLATATGKDVAVHTNRVVKKAVKKN